MFIGLSGRKEGKSGYVFGSPWSVSDLQTTLVTSNPGTMIGDELVLQPNFNVYAGALGGTDADRAFWTNGTDGGVTAGPEGNKWMVAQSYVETTPIAESSFTLQGLVSSNTLDATYQAQAFIRVRDPDLGFAIVLNETSLLPASGAFSVTADLSAFTGMIQETGFSISGLNANPVDEASLGSVSVTVVPEPSTLGLLGLGTLAAVYRLRRRIFRSIPD